MSIPTLPQTPCQQSVDQDGLAHIIYQELHPSYRASRRHKRPKRRPGKISVAAIRRACLKPERSID